jgi:predicted MPP superfamily phosphohydrolase
MNKLDFSLFLFTVSLTYFLIHYFVFLRITNGLALSPLFRTALKIFFIIAALSFFVDRLLSRHIFFKPLAFLIAHFGSVWLGVISIAFSLFVIQYILSLIFSNQIRLMTFITLVLVVFVSCFALFNGTTPPRIKVLRIPMKGLPPALEGFSIVQLSDLHLDRWKSEPWLKSVVEKANKLNPDLVVITGDLVENDIQRCKNFIDILKQIESKQGVLAVTGNHEFYSGIENFLEFSRSANIKVLRNQKILISNGIEIIGMDDETGKIMTGVRPDLKSVVNDCDFNKPIILLSHRPKNFQNAANLGVDLQLSGHTHAGQIPPMDLIVHLIYKYPYGLYRHNDSMIYTTCGTGIWGPPMRLFSRSEIVKIELGAQKSHPAIFYP